MYTIDRNEKFYMIDRSPTRWDSRGHVTELDGYDELIKAVARVVIYDRHVFLWDFCTEFKPYINIDFSGNDYNLDGSPKRFMFLDSNGGIIDVRMFDKDVYKAWQNRWTKRCVDYFFNGNAEDAGTTIRKYSDSYYKFRRGPVGYTSCALHSYTPKSHISQLARQYENLRPKVRVSSYWLWDYTTRHTDRSWKSSYKCKHQWEKHLVRRGGKGVYVEKENVNGD